MTLTARPADVGQAGIRSFLAKCGAYALTFPTAILVSRLVGPGGRGAYYLPITLVTVAFTVGCMGVVQAQFRLWSAPGVTRQDLMAAVMALGGLLSALWLGAGLVLGWYLRHTILRGIPFRYLLIASLALPLQLTASFGSGILAITGRVPASTLGYLLGSVIQLLLLTGCAVTGMVSVSSVLGVYVVSSMATCVFMLRTCGVRPRVSRAIARLWGRLLRVGVGVQPYVVFAYLNLRVDTLIVAGYCPLRAVGVYSVAVAVSEMLGLLSDALSFALVQRQAEELVTDVFRLTAQGIRASVLLSALGAVCLAGAIPVIVPVLFGEAYSDARTPALILLPASIAMAIWKPIAAPMIRLARPWMQGGCASVAAGVNVAANLALVPRYGIDGAAVASVVSYWTGALLMVGWLVAPGRCRLRELIPGKRDLDAILGSVRAGCIALGERLLRARDSSGPRVPPAAPIEPR